MADQQPITNDTESDDALISRLYELAGNDDSGELARIDAMVYERLLQAYGDDSETAAA
ncbi:MAG TPA: hypothetical protein VFY12_10655 [Arenimonas sp.]|nr:hypothetical protein [Arenimonas sp.]